MSGAGKHGGEGRTARVLDGRVEVGDAEHLEGLQGDPRVALVVLHGSETNARRAPLLGLERIAKASGRV